VTSEDDWQKAVEAAVTRFGKLNIPHSGRGGGGIGPQIANPPKIEAKV
jgi:hypothetical protein